MDKEQDLYEILGLTSDATESEIKKAYYKLAKTYHPDKNKQTDSEEKFKKINHAYAILSNPEKKEIYDKFGEEGLKAGMGDGNMDPMADLFKKMHDPFFQKPKVAKMFHEISLEDYFTKKTVIIPIPKSIKCDDCNATGFVDKKNHQCKTCHGTGMIVQTINQGPFIQQIQQMCHACKGQKVDTKSLDIKCKKCNYGVIKIDEEIEVDIPKDIISNPCTIVPEKGPIYGNKNLDLAVIFKIKMASNYARTTNGKLMYIMHINLTETLCGFKRIIKHPSGKELLLVSEPGYVINPDNIYIMDKIGFAEDVMYLTFIIHYPETIKLPKRKPLTFENLEMALGSRRVPNVTGIPDIESENVFTIGKLNKMSNKKPKEDDEENGGNDSDDDDAEGIPPGQGFSVGPGCAQQ
ncbi:MAG: hypothetical protein Satyrvirus37_5 [Satyrvirus sp.]|uniref:DnaJ-like protein n=1 Tax=Satyrvirus sp. TaxID=2487771 RepID=A0A3G5AF01_9VIRU|nr:MAG: hypothetical protein Satyrvirus37_5 [Satyrvirus sp.]